MSDDDLLIQADSILSLIRYREPFGLSAQSIQDIDGLLSQLRRRTDEIIAQRRSSSPTEGQ